MSAGALFAAPVLVSHLNVLDNIRLPWVVDGERLDQAYLDILVDTLELRDVLLSYPADLSGSSTPYLRRWLSRALAV